MNDLHPLGKLIQSIQDENGWTDVDVANRAVERGHETSKQSIGLYKKKDVVSITARQINLLSAGLGVSPMTVIRAAAESMGVEDQSASDSDLTEVVRTTTELSERDKRLVMSLLSAMRAEESSEHETDKTPEQAPPTNLRSISSAYHAEDPELEQKTPPMPDPDLLASHPDMTIQADRDDEFFDGLGEESQDGGGDH